MFERAQRYPQADVSRNNIDVARRMRGFIKNLHMAAHAAKILSNYTSDSPSIDRIYLELRNIEGLLGERIMSSNTHLVARKNFRKRETAFGSTGGICKTT